MDVTKSFEFIWFGDVHGPTPYKFTGFRRAFISQTPLFFEPDAFPGLPGSAEAPECQNSVGRPGAEFVVYLEIVLPGRISAGF